ncbi:MFS transporter [Nocardioides sambongensis]|uniref:MFS transporter n=1 Tax=Nocardioides sambongensis TaxID=2589074 RepID=UPI001E44AD2E|nr:MFS transporter [Nocardioides sambongensis]
MPILVLYLLDRGLTVPQALTVSAISGIAVMVLELPTSGFADGFGRRPVYVAAAVVNVAAAVGYLVAQDFWMFAVASCLMGTFRALDSGPLEAWYVDTTHLTDPAADVDGVLAQQGAVLGGGIAAGSLISGALVWWHPVGAMSALTLPVVLYVVLNVAHLVAVLALMHEPPRPAPTPRTPPSTSAPTPAPAARDGPGRRSAVRRGWCSTVSACCAATACSGGW